MLHPGGACGSSGSGELKGGAWLVREDGWSASDGAFWATRRKYLSRSKSQESSSHTAQKSHKPDADRSLTLRHGGWWPPSRPVWPLALRPKSLLSKRREKTF